MGKVINDWCLKISLTDRCNYKCFYCNDYQMQMSKQKNSTIEKSEVIDILKAGREAGIEKVHWTGGEPSVAELLFFSDYAKEIGYTEQVITTNGYLMYDKIEPMVANGLVGINISLDSLNREKYKKITGVDGLEEVLKVIKLSSEKVKLTKVSVALMKDNIDEIPEIVDYVASLGDGVLVKLFEFWKFNPSDVYEKLHVKPEKIKSTLQSIGELETLDGVKGNNINAEYFKIKGKDAVVGIVQAPTNYKCGGPSCKKIRIYVNGRTCEGKKMFEVDYNGKVELLKKIMDRRTNTVVDR